MAGMAYDCMAWEALRQALAHATSLKHFEAVDRAESAMTSFATKVMADNRRMASVQTNCPSLFAQMQQYARATPRQIADPAHDPAILESWLDGLPDDVLADIGAAVKANQAARKKKPAKKKA